MGSTKSSQAGSRNQPRLRERRRIKLRQRRLFACLWLVAWGALLHQGLTAPFWHVETVAASCPDPALQRWSVQRLDQAQGEHLLTIDPRRWQERLEANPLVKRAEVSRGLWPARLTAVVTVRKPWLQGEWQIDGQTRVGSIDRDGHVLPLPDDTKTATGLRFRLPPPEGNRVQPGVMKGLSVLVAYQDSEGLPKGGSFDLSDPQNVVWQSGTVIVWLGDLSEFSEQLKVKLGGILPLLLPLAKEKGRQLEYVDLRDWQYPVLKMR